MRDRRGSRAIILTVLVAMIPQSVFGGDWPFRRRAKPDLPNSLEQVARSIDAVEDKILDDGTVVLKQPDVYGQSRMTLYRKNFEQQLYGAINNFNVILSARVARSDQAAFASQTALQNTLASGAGTRGGQRTTPAGGGAASNSSTTNLVSAGGSGNGSDSGSDSGPFDALKSLFATNTIATNAPFSGLGGHPFANMGGAYQLGLEPTVYLDQLKDYQDHLNELRRVNMGDDVVDSAGYGLYLVRMPVSIQPGESTHKGHGAVLTATVRHDFGKEFLYQTYRNLVVNDLVDQLTPIAYELIRSRYLFDKSYTDFFTYYNGNEFHYDEYGREPSYFGSYFAYERKVRSLRGRDLSVDELRDTLLRPDEDDIEASKKPDTSAMREIRNLNNSIQISQGLNEAITITRVNGRDYPLSPYDYNLAFIPQNLLVLALAAKGAMTTPEPRANEVRSFLRKEIEAAYDILVNRQTPTNFEDKVDVIAERLESRRFHDLTRHYIDLARSLPGNLEFSNRDYDGSPKLSPDGKNCKTDAHNALIDPATILCYAITVEAGLLNNRLREDMKRTDGQRGFVCPPNVDAMAFYARCPAPEVEETFEEYIKARWPIITFALEPVVDEQNIADASSIRRDLQLALAFAFSTGQIGFRQLIQYQRRLEIDAETIALNRKVTAFAHGNETFGYRFTPRFQNPPQERSNISAVYNQVVKGGPGRNYQMKNSKLEPGQRELNVAIVMPSFLQGVKFDVMSNWFPLHDPDQMDIPRAQMVEQGRKVMKLKHDMATLEACGEYRPGDIRRLAVQVDQLEAMLPMQTYSVRVPYENTLGGFQLFQQGSTALVPQLLGFEGADGIDPDEETDLLIYGKHFSIQETQVVVGGKYLAGRDLDIDKALAAVVSSVDAAGKQAQAAAPSDATDDDDQAGTPQDGTSTKKGTANDQAAKANRKAMSKTGEVVKATADTLKKVAAASKTPTAPAGGMGPATPGQPSTVNNPYVEVVSREVLRIKVPAKTQATAILNADTATEKTTAYVEVYVATPTGISNRLLVPVRSKAVVKADTPSTQMADGDRAGHAARQAFPPGSVSAPDPTLPPSEEPQSPRPRRSDGRTSTAPEDHKFQGTSKPAGSGGQNLPDSRIYTEGHDTSEALPPLPGSRPANPKPSLLAAPRPRIAPARPAAPPHATEGTSPRQSGAGPPGGRARPPCPDSHSRSGGSKSSHAGSIRHQAYRAEHSQGEAQPL